MDYSTAKKGLEIWVPIVVSLVALYISYASYNNSQLSNRPLLEVDYITVRGGEQTELKEIMTLTSGPTDIERVKYITKHFFKPLTNYFEGRVRIASSPTTENTSAYGAYNALEFMLIHNALPGHCESIQVDVDIFKKYMPNLPETIAHNQNTTKQSLTYRGLNSNEWLAIPLKFVKQKSFVQIKQLLGPPNEGIVVSTEVKNISYTGAPNSTQYTLLPRPKYSDSMFIGDQLQIQTLNSELKMLEENAGKND